MLVGPFEIERGGPFEIEPLLQNEGVGRARVEPNVENVAGLLPFGGISDEVGEEALGCAALEPGIRAFGAERREDALDQLGRAVDSGARDDFARFLVAKHADGNAQARWRETTQAGRVSILPVMRFLPCGGPRRVAPIDASARLLSVPWFELPGVDSGAGLSMAMNHCGVARKITGFFDRQECG